MVMCVPAVGGFAARVTPPTVAARSVVVVEGAQTSVMEVGLVRIAVGSPDTGKVGGRSMTPPGC